MEDNKDILDVETQDVESQDAEVQDAPKGKYGSLTTADDSMRRLTGMYKNWFLDYASYVILERAVPHLADGLKPVQRRILHAMKCVEDGRFNKVANVVGQAMQYHPHGDASIKDLLEFYMGKNTPDRKDFIVANLRVEEDIVDNPKNID